jgi:hypothetical protein
VNAPQRFAIRRYRWLRPLLWLFGGTASHSYVEVGPEGVEIKFGLFEMRNAFNDITSVASGRWPWWGGLGWRTNLVGRIGLVASYRGIVDIQLRRRRWVWLVVIPTPCSRVTISLEDPDTFIAAVTALLKQPA